jgi:hypothetical protein
LSFIILGSVQMTKDGYTMKGDSRGGQLIGTSPSGGSRLIVNVMNYRKRRAERTADCPGHIHPLKEIQMDALSLG